MEPRLEGSSVAVLGGGPGYQAVGVGGVLRARNVIEGEVDAVLGAGPADAVVDRGGVVGAAELHGQVGLPLHAALRHRRVELEHPPTDGRLQARAFGEGFLQPRSEEHTSELQSLMRNSYAVFCFKKKNTNNAPTHS